MDKELFARNQIIANLMRIGHGDLSLYVPEGLKAAKHDPEFFAHVIAYNAIKGEVRDSKVALPVIALRGLSKGDDEMAENAIAHLLSLGPRELDRAYQFSKKLSAEGYLIHGGYRKQLQAGIQTYLKTREGKRAQWDAAALSNRAAMVSLYAVSHTKPSPRAQAILFDKQYPKNSVFAAVAGLRDMSAQEAAGTILNFKIPFPIAIGAGVNVKDEIVALALLNEMTGSEAINNTAMLKKLGVLDNPVLRAVYDEALGKAENDKRVSTLKASRAADAVGGEAAKKLQKIQEKKLENLGGIEGNWLVLGDKSGSMNESIEVAKQIASLIAQQVKGAVYLVWFNVTPTLMDVTGKTLEQIKNETKYVRASGGTSIGCGLELMREKGIVVNGIAIASDGGDNTSPNYHDAYRKYSREFSTEPMTYLFHVPGEANVLEAHCKASGVPLEVYELGRTVDYYSLPNIVKNLKAGRYALLDEIMQTPLLTLDAVFG